MSKASYFVILALILININSAKFNIASTSRCVETSKAGFCTRWQQNGTVQQQTVACFPGQVLVLTKDGYKRLDELSIGESILAYDRSQGEVYTKVRGWFHRQPEKTGAYLNLTFENGENLIVSEKHNVALKNEEKKFTFRFAEEFTIKDQIYGSEHYVSNIESTSFVGLYAPMTYNSNYFVFTSTSDKKVKILAHDYANIRYPESYEPFVNIVLSAHEYFNGKQVGNGIHPAAEKLMKTFSFLLE